MNDWVHNLPVLWMTIVVCGGTYLLTAIIYLLVVFLAKGERVRVLKIVSPGLLSPLGTVFGLFVAFTALQVWNDNDQAKAAVDREASSLRAAVILAGGLPEEPRERLRGLIARHIKKVIGQEWAMMAHRNATLNTMPQDLAQALQLTLELAPGTPGQQTAQRDIVAALDDALDARRQRILISRSEVGFFKWACLLGQAACVLFAIGLLHCDHRLATGIAMGIFAACVAVCLLLILGYDRPFIGHFSIASDPLLQVLPDASQIGANAASNDLK
jgi:hypothetical protein